MRGEDFIWREFYAWRPLIPADEQRIFWLERVWRRRARETGRWEYRSFRDEDTKVRELMDREI